MTNLGKIQAEIANSLIKEAQDAFWTLLADSKRRGLFFSKFKFSSIFRNNPIVSSDMMQIVNRELLFVYAFLLCKNDDEKAKFFIARYFMDEKDFEELSRDHVYLYAMKLKKYRIWYENFLNSKEIVNTFYWEVPKELVHLLGQDKNVFLMQQIADFLMKTTNYMDYEMDEASIRALTKSTDDLLRARKVGENLDEQINLF